MGKLGDSGWRWLRKDPPPKGLRQFWVGHSEGGRRAFVFLWPGRGGKLAFWVEGFEGNNVELTSFQPDVWHPGPPDIPGSWVAKRKGTR